MRNENEMCIIFTDMTINLRAIVIGIKHVLQVNVARYRYNKICLQGMSTFNVHYRITRNAVPFS